MIILASGSPRRLELLGRLQIPFAVDAADVDESASGGAEDIVRTLSRRKAEAVAARHPGKQVLAADTVVCLGDAILGKPEDPTDAARMLRMLSGRWHEVWTGVCVIDAKCLRQGAACTRVRFTELSEADIARYVETGDPLDKAGAYAIQGMAGFFIDRVEGCPHNVMGLPLALTKTLLGR